MKTTTLRSFTTLVLLGSALALSACDSTSTVDPVDTAPEKNAAAPTQIDRIDAKGAAEALASDAKPMVIDIRTPEEFAEGHIEGATMIDFKSPDFESKVSELDRNQTYLLHCRSGARSTASLPTFEKLGFKHILHLDGGFNEWAESGQPVTK